MSLTENLELVDNVLKQLERVPAGEIGVLTNSK